MNSKKPKVDYARLERLLDERYSTPSTSVAIKTHAVDQANEIVFRHMVQDMEEFFEHCMSASCEKAFGDDGLGGCKHYEKEAYPARFQEFLDMYVNREDISACEALSRYLLKAGYLSLREKT